MLFLLYTSLATPPTPPLSLFSSFIFLRSQLNLLGRAGMAVAQARLYNLGGTLQSASLVRKPLFAIVVVDWLHLNP